MLLNKSNRVGTSSCSLSPSESTNRDGKDGTDSDYESDHGEDRFDTLGNLVNIRWIGPGRTIPILVFNTKDFFAGDPTLKNCGAQNNLACKVTGDSLILREILVAHGFNEVGMAHRRFNLAWTGRHTKPSYVKRMAYCHTINHFPRTEELTRKDKLYKNIIKMQQSKGKQHFDFVPLSFKMPSQYRSLHSHYKKEKGLYIVKPVCLSRGRGVFVIDNPKKINSTLIEGHRESNEIKHKNIVSKYILNPLIINGYKCDLRIYVTVTSFDPLVIYMYSEGLTRFATVKYDLSSNCLNERCMHLTNYSINMDSEKYVKNIDSSVEDEGSKWSLGALLRYFKSQGKDTIAIMNSIEDVVIKTILSVEWKVGAACKQYVRHRHNCFEVFGFDILLDDNYKPWLIEVNLSPSLCCDTPLDLKVKGNMLCDLLNLIGVRCYDPNMQNLSALENKGFLFMLRNRLKNSYGHYYYRLFRDACQRAYGMRHSRKRLKIMLDLENNWPEGSELSRKRNRAINFLATLKREQVEIIQQVREEDSRRRGWVRIFPTSDTWEKYCKFMDYPTTNNLILHQRLYPERHKVMTAGRSPLAGLVTPSQSVNEILCQFPGQINENNEKISKALIEQLQRMREYEKPLLILPPSNYILKKEVSVNDYRMNTNPLSRDEYLEQSFQEKLFCEGRWEQNDEQSINVGVLFPPTYNSKISASDSQAAGDQVTLPTIELGCEIVCLLEEGHSLSNIQARDVFTAYLWNIQKMLLMGSGELTSQENVDAFSYLMNLTTVFLKQAVKYLIQPLDVDLPKKNVSLTKHMQLVANSLTKFIILYTEETEALKANEDQVKLEQSKILSNNSHFLDDVKFKQYIKKASLKELEMLLVLYSTSHDPVTTFLGKCSEQKT